MTKAPRDSRKELKKKKIKNQCRARKELSQ
jgi:hypothetical protein